MNLFVTNLRIMLVLFCTYYREGDYCCNVLCDGARSVKRGFLAELLSRCGQQSQLPGALGPKV